MIRTPAPLIEYDPMLIDTLAGRPFARLHLRFPNVAGRGRHRRAAAERLAAVWTGVRAERTKVIADDWGGRDPYGPPPWTYGSRDLVITGAPAHVAAFIAALPHLFAELERQATIAVRAYGRWLRSGAADLEMEPHQHRSAMRSWRATIVDELAYIAARPPAWRGPGFCEETSWSWQARAYARDLLPGIEDLEAYRDEEAAAAILAAAFYVTDPIIIVDPVEAEAIETQAQATEPQQDAPAVAEATQQSEETEELALFDRETLAAVEVLEAAAAVVNAVELEEHEADHQAQDAPPVPIGTTRPRPPRRHRPSRTTARHRPAERTPRHRRPGAPTGSRPPSRRVLIRS